MGLNKIQFPRCSKYRPSPAKRAPQFMISARRQAEEYAKALPPAHGWPPFVLVCDGGHCIEV